MEYQKNDLIELQITGMTAEGAGIGRADGLAVFVPLSAPGDLLQVKIIKKAKSYAYGKIERILTPSPDRIAVDCPVFSRCGGCCYRHINYEAELRIKTERVRDALERIGGFTNPPLFPILSAPDRNGYRNKALLPLGTGPDGQLSMGFYAVNSHRIIDCEACLLQPADFNAVMSAFRGWAAAYGDPVYDEGTHKGTMRRLYLRKGEKSGEVVACVVINGNGLHHEKELEQALRSTLPSLTGLVVNSHTEKTNVALGKRCRTVFGKEAVEDELCGLQFQISPLSFYQVNRSQAQRLYEKAAEYAALTGRETVLDLYCGTGTIGLSMAKQAKKVIGVEIVPQAVDNAKENARKNDIQNAEFLCADAAKAAQVLREQGIQADVILLDPPRKGCDEALLKTAAAFSPARIVYISCDPATLARDLRLLAELGYHMQAVTPVDMFPATAHVECVALLTREGK